MDRSRSRILFKNTRGQAIALLALLILLLAGTPAAALKDGETVGVDFRWEGADDDGPYTIQVYSGTLVVGAGTELSLSVYRQNTNGGERGIPNQISGSAFLDLADNSVSVRWFGQSQSGTLVADITRDAGVGEIITGVSTSESGLISGVVTGNSPAYSDYELSGTGLSFAGYQTGIDATQTATLQTGDDPGEDETPPVITLLGPNPQTLECGDPYVEQGATALDETDGDISAAVMIDDADVNPLVPASYVVRYNVSDAAGNAAIEVTRTVQVIDTQNPAVTIDSPADGAVFAPGATVDVEYTVEDGCDLLPGPTVTVSPGNPFVLPGVPGSQTITVSAMDASGNVGSTSITVFVEAQQVDVETVLSDLMDDVEDLVEGGSLNGGQGNALTRKLRHILARVQEGRIQPAIGQLQAFKNQVTDLMAEGVLGDEEGQALLDAAQMACDLLRPGSGGDGGELAKGARPSAQLGPAFPNPFNPSTVIQYQLPAAGLVELAVYNLAGQRIRTLVHEHRDAGSHRVTWNGRDDQGRGVASGVYLYRLTSGTFTETQRMLLLK